MENIRSVETERGSLTAFEDRVYRNSYTGVGEAISAALKGQHEGEICLVVADRNGIPQLKITIDGELTTQYHRGAVSLEQVYRGMELSTCADEEMEQLRGSRTTARSAGRPDPDPSTLPCFWKIRASTSCTAMQWHWPRHWKCRCGRGLS